MGIYDNLNDAHLDVLKELASIGSGNAVSALAKMLNKKVRMPVPKVNLLEFKDIASFVGGPENIVVGILVSISGELQGIMMFLMRTQVARTMVEIIVGSPEGSGDEFSEMGKSVIQEIGNIMIGSYLGSLAGLINKKIRPSIPFLSIDMANAILSVPAIEFGKVADRVLFIESAFSVEQVDVSGYFLLVPDLPSFESILKALGVE
jgi:chemotaxis protein CheC